MRERFNNFRAFFSAYRLHLVAIFSLIPFLFGGYWILVSAKSHVEFWPAIGSWIGGIATLVGVCLAWIEYIASKKAKGIYEIIEINDHVNHEYYQNWYLTILSQIEAYTLFRIFRDNESSSLAKDYFELYEISLNKTRLRQREFNQSFTKLCKLTQTLKFLSKDKHSILEGRILSLSELNSDSNEFKALFDHTFFGNEYEFHCAELRDFIEIAKYKDSYKHSFNIQFDSEFRTFITKVKKNRFHTFNEKLEMLN